MKKTLLSLAALSTLSFGATNEELSREIEFLKQEMASMKEEQAQTNESLIEEIANKTIDGTTEYESYTAMGDAASKVYFAEDGLSIGGYGEMYFEKYSDYKNSNEATNKAKNMGTTSILRFIPYIGYKFNDWIILNTEIEFEDGGARSDGTKNYKYAIVEFAYLDFLFNENFALRVGHILTPMGLINLNHEPISFLTTDRPEVESIIIPSTWHTNGIIAHGEIVEGLEYQAGIITSPDADHFGDEEGKYIKNGRQGAKQYTDSYSFVARASYDISSGFNVGGSFLYGNSKGFNSDAEVTMFLTEAHASYKKDGWNVQALATYGSLDGDLDELPVGSYEEDIPYVVADSVNGQYLTVGYDIFSLFKLSHQGYLVGEVERLDMDAGDQTYYSDNNKFMEYTTGFTYFPDPRIVLKTDYKVRDYADGAKKADEKSFAVNLGFIF